MQCVLFVFNRYRFEIQQLTISKNFPTSGLDLDSPSYLAFVSSGKNDKHRFTLHQAFGSSEYMTSKVTWHTCRVAKTTNIDSHCTRPSGLVNIWPARSPGVHAGRLNKGQDSLHCAWWSYDHLRPAAHKFLLKCNLPLPNPLYKMALCQIRPGEKQ